MNKTQNKPPVAGAKAKDSGKTIKRLLAFFKPFRASLIIVVVCALFATVFNILGPKILGGATDLIVQGATTGQFNFASLGTRLLMLAVIYIVSALFALMQQRITARVAQKAIYSLRRDVNHKLSRLPLNYFDTHTHGEVLSRTTTDIERIGATLQQAMTQLISAACTIVGILVMMFTISWQMAIIAVLMLPLALLFTTFVIRKSQKHYIRQQRKLGEINGYVEEMYSGHNIIKLFRREQKTREQFEKTNEELYQAGYKAQFASSIIMPVVNFVGNLGYVAICVLGASLAGSGVITIGSIQAFIQYVQQFTQPLVQTSNISNVLQASIASAERVFELLDEPDQPAERESLTTMEKTGGKVSFEHVRFGYSPDKILIKDMNLEVKGGQKIAVVGPTGAGKSTIINLLMRFYELNGGSIKIDGVDIRDMSREDVRSLFGMVLQETWLYSGSVRNNIAYGDPNMSDDDVVAAAKMANVDFFIRTWPGGYDMEISEDADNISQGQKQLLTIARAFACDPQILILDEATSSVDTRTEQLIQEAMQKLTVGRTSFVIAHRLSTIKDSDVILVMKDGDIIEQGNHDQLMAMNGFYTGLYNSQFA